MKTIEKDMIVFFIIVEHGKAKKAIHLGQKLGALGQVIFLGHGVIDDTVLSFLGFSKS